MADLQISGVAFFQYDYWPAWTVYAGNRQWGDPTGLFRTVGALHPTPAPNMGYMDGANKIFVRGLAGFEFGNPWSVGGRSARGTPEAPLPLLRGDPVVNYWAQPLDSSGEVETPAAGPGRVGMWYYACAENPTPTARGGVFVRTITKKGDVQNRPYSWDDDSGRVTIIGDGYEAGVYQPLTAELVPEAERGTVNLGVPRTGPSAVVQTIRMLANSVFGFDWRIDQTTGRLELWRINGPGASDRGGVAYFERGSRIMGVYGGFRYAPVTLYPSDPSKIIDAYGTVIRADSAPGGSGEGSQFYCRNLTGQHAMIYSDGTCFRRVSDDSPIS